MKFLIIICVASCLWPFSAYGQQKPKAAFGRSLLSLNEPKNWMLSGYISNMQSAMFDSISNDWLVDNQIHNRLNFKWYPKSWLTTTIEIRNRFFWGESLESAALFGLNYTDNYARDRGLVDLSANIAEGESFLLNSMVDRFYLSFEQGNFNATIGRQRINWGQTFAWNPNDLFNSYSFFDFDYEEKPGSDAIRLQYYTGVTSSVELAAKIDSAEKISAAGLFRFSRWEYDWQFLAGIVNQEDYAIGLGWSGNIKGAGLRGEVSYFQPVDEFSDTTGLVVASLMLDYTFKNSLFVQIEALYNQMPESGTVNNFTDYYQQPLSVKSLSFTEYNFLGQISYPCTPLLNITLSGMYYPEIKGFYLGPSVDYSLKDNLTIACFGQLFAGEFPNPLSGKEEKQQFNFGFLRLKWSF